MVETNPQSHDAVGICSYQKHFLNEGEGYKLCMDYTCKKNKYYYITNCI